MLFETLLYHAKKSSSILIIIGIHENHVILLGCFTCLIGISDSPITIPVNNRQISRISWSVG